METVLVAAKRHVDYIHVLRNVAADPCGLLSHDLVLLDDVLVDDREVEPEVHDHPGLVGVKFENGAPDVASGAAEDFQLDGVDAAGPDAVDVDAVVGDVGVDHVPSAA